MLDSGHSSKESTGLGDNSDLGCEKGIVQHNSNLWPEQLQG